MNSQRPDDPTDESETGDAVVNPDTIRVKVTVWPPTVWTTSRFAQSWYEDAFAEAAEAGDDARRREILFAVCCAETYLFEWVIDWIGPTNVEELFGYFPKDDRRGIKEQWKETLKRFRDEGRIEEIPDFGGPHGEDWKGLVRYRDGLVHANASRPSAGPVPEDWLPFPTIEDLRNLEGGWATRVVANHIRLLHQVHPTPPPEWVVDP